MVTIVPNYFLSKQNSIDLNDTVFTAYSSKITNENIDIRTTMHSMIILLEGNKRISNENNTLKASAKNIIFLTQNNYYMSEFITKNNKYKSLIVYFDDEFIKKFIFKYKIKLNVVNNISNMFKIDYNHKETYLLNINLLKQYINKKENNLMKLKLEEIFLLSLNDNKFISFLSNIQKSIPNRIQNILQMNIDNIETVNDMCKLTKLSTNQLRRYFIKMYNQNPKKWLNEQRLQKAVMLLKNTDKSISKISIECRYATVSWFIYSFKTKYNKTPKEIRYKV